MHLVEGDDRSAGISTDLGEPGEGHLPVERRVLHRLGGEGRGELGEAGSEGVGGRPGAAGVGQQVVGGVDEGRIEVGPPDP